MIFHRNVGRPISVIGGFGIIWGPQTKAIYTYIYRYIHWFLSSIFTANWVIIYYLLLMAEIRRSPVDMENVSLFFI